MFDPRDVKPGDLVTVVDVQMAGDTLFKRETVRVRIPGSARDGRPGTREVAHGAGA